jgi:hypothetical protein
METKNDNVSVYVVYGGKKEITRLVYLLTALEMPYSYSGEYCYFNSDITELLNSQCPELGLKCEKETWSTNCFNFR